MQEEDTPKLVKQLKEKIEEVRNLKLNLNSFPVAVFVSKDKKITEKLIEKFGNSYKIGGAEDSEIMAVDSKTRLRGVDKEVIADFAFSQRQFLSFANSTK